MDSDPRLGEMVAKKLGDHGFYCCSISNPEIGLAELRREAWSMVLLDLHLPENMSLEMANLARQNPSKPEVVMMAENVRQSIFAGHQAGACTVLAKPLNVDQILAAVHRFCPEVGGRRFDGDLAHPAISALFDDVKTGGRRIEVKIEASDIGRGGFFLRVPKGEQVPDVGQVIDFDLKLGMVPNTRFRGRGLVRWAYREMGTTGVGIEFLSIPAEGEKLVGAFAELFKIMPFVPVPAPLNGKK